jgi:hypothetical protein
MTRADTPAYRAAYERGWRNSKSESASLDRADARGEPEAWYDGYLDYAADREKWHLLRCIGCYEHPAAGKTSADYA